jgi:hypothetical protein
MSAEEVTRAPTNKDEFNGSATKRWYLLVTTEFLF